MPAPIAFVVDGHAVEVPDDGASLLEALRDRLGLRSPKDGCGPQGQCGCCTVLVDDQPRVACVTPVRRVAGRAVTTVDGLAGADRWAAAFAATGASQCGFCTPGIIVRLAAAAARGRLDAQRVDQALLAHLCRCTGWQTIREAAALACSPDGAPPAPRGEQDGAARRVVLDGAARRAVLDGAARRAVLDGAARRAVLDGAARRAVLDGAARRAVLDGAARRAVLEGGAVQAVGVHVALGRGGFADDTAPADALVAVPRMDGSWALGETLTEARAAAGKVQGRRTTEAVGWPLEVPSGTWARTLRTTWVEPGYLETDASWCHPGGEPVTPLANGGAFGGKRHSAVAAVARRLADETGRPVRALYAREDAVRFGPKRPPIAAGIDTDGRGVLRVARTPGIADAVALMAPDLAVEERDVAGPPTSADLRAAGWAEAAILLAALGAAPDTVTAPDGAVASATIAADGTVEVAVRCGEPLDEVVLRSYCIGAAHMALGWVTTEALAVDDDGRPLDLTIRSFGIRRAMDTPRIDVSIEDDHGEPVNGSDAVFAAVAAAVWRSLGHPPAWPAQRGPSA